MNRREFIELSEKSVKKLNGNSTAENTQCWREGFDVAKNQVKEIIQNMGMDEAMCELEDFIYLPISLFD